MGENWKKYVEECAEEYDVPFDRAWALFGVLGPSEAYDGFIAMLEDLALERNVPRRNSDAWWLG